MPLLLAAGMPPLHQDAGVSGTEVCHASPAVGWRQAGFDAWLLRLYQWTILPPDATATTAPRLQSKSWPEPAADVAALKAAEQDAEVTWVVPLLRRLRRWHKRLVRDGRRFSRLTDEQRHELRKLGKRLRYNLLFAESLLPARRLKPYKAQLAVVQDALGEINDWVTARDALKMRAHAEPQAWFGVGWLSAGLEPRYERAAAEFRKLEALKPFWGKRLG